MGSLFIVIAQISLLLKINGEDIYRNRIIKLLMKKAILFLFLIVCFSASLKAQDLLPKTVEIVTYLSKGDTLTYIIEEGKKKYVKEKLTDSTMTEKKMKLIVIDSTEKGYLIQIDMVNDKKTDDLIQDFMQDESNFSFLYSLKDFKLQYRISPVGVFEGFENMPTLTKVMSKTFDFYFDKAKIEPKKAERLKKTFLSEPYLVSIMGKHVSLLHAWHGYEYELDTVKTFDNPLPNLFSQKGGTIPAKSEFLAEYTDSTGIYVELQQVTNADKEALKSLLNDAGTAMAFDKKLKKEMKKLEMNLFQKLTCEYHLPSGVPTYLFFKKVIEAKEKDKDDTSVNLEYVEITLE
jgi:hypothetical protein